MTPATETAEAPVVERRSMSGEVLGSVQLDPAIFAVPVNVPLLHQVITAQLANRRAGTQSTKTRAEVAGGSSKPYRQKGTGNARQGSIRAPHYAGGGVALGPKPRSYAQRTPKKMVQAALRCALSDRARAGELRLVDEFRFEVPKTKAAIAALEALECSGRVLVVIGRGEENVVRSFRNLGHVVTLPADQLSAYDVLGADVVVFTDATLPGSATTAADKPARARQAAAKPAVPESEAAATEEAAAAAPATAGAEEAAVAEESPVTESGEAPAEGEEEAK